MWGGIPPRACVIGLFVTLCSLSARADLRTVTFSNPSGVPTGHNPDTGGILTPTSQNFSENGIHVEAFWAPNVPDTHRWPSGFRPDAHFHHLENGYETSHGFRTSTAVSTGDIQGVYLTMQDGHFFDLESLDYRLLSPLQSTNILVSTDFDPFNPTTAQFTPFAVTVHPTFTTLNLGDAFDHVTHLFISSDLGGNPLNRIRWDNIVINHHTTSTAFVPLPNAAILGGLGLGLVACVRRGRR